MNEEIKREQNAERASRHYQKKRAERGLDYTPRLEKQMETAGTRTYGFRCKISTVVSAYDTMEAFGGSAGGRGIGSVLVNVLDSCMDSLRRDGLIPLRTADEIQERFSEISGETFKKPLVQLPSLPAGPSHKPNVRDLTEQIGEAVAHAQENKEIEEKTEIYEPKKFSIGDVPTEKPLEDRVFERANDALVKEASESGDPSCKDALIKTYKTLPESLWGTATARTLYLANLDLKE